MSTLAHSLRSFTGLFAYCSHRLSLFLLLSSVKLRFVHSPASFQSASRLYCCSVPSSFALLFHRLPSTQPLAYIIVQLYRASLCSLTGFLPVSLSLILMLSPIELHLLTRISRGILHNKHHNHNHNHIRTKDKCVKL